jgi:hypothetical protein
MRIFYWNVGTEKIERMLEMCTALAKDNEKDYKDIGYVLEFVKVLSCTLNFILDVKGITDQKIPRSEEKLKPAEAKQLYLSNCNVGKIPEQVMDGLFHYFGCARQANQSELFSFCKDIFARLDTIKVENLTSLGTIKGTSDRYGNTVFDLVTKTLEKHGSTIGIGLEEFYQRFIKFNANASNALLEDRRYQLHASKQKENDLKSCDPPEFRTHKKGKELMEALRSFVPEQKKTRFQSLLGVKFVSTVFDARTFGHNKNYREERLQDFYYHCFVEKGLLSFNEPLDVELVLQTVKRPEKILRLIYREVEIKNDFFDKIIEGGRFEVKELDLESESKCKMKFKSLCHAYFKDFESSSETFSMLQTKVNKRGIKLLRYKYNESEEEKDYKRAVPDHIRTVLMTEGKLELLKKVIALYISVGGSIKMCRDLYDLSLELAFKHLEAVVVAKKPKEAKKKKGYQPTDLELRRDSMYEWKFRFEKMILFAEEELEIIQNHRLLVSITRNLSFRRRVFEPMVADFTDNKCTMEVENFIRRLFTVNEHYSSFNALTYFPSYLEYFSEAMRLFSFHPTKYNLLLEELAKKDLEASQQNRDLVDPVAFVNFSDYKKGILKQLVSSAVQKGILDPTNEVDLEYIIMSIGGFYTYIPLNFHKSHEALKIMSEITEQTTLEVGSVQSLLKQRNRGSCVQFLDTFFADMNSDLKRFTYLKPLIDKLQGDALQQRIESMNKRNIKVEVKEEPNAQYTEVKAQSYVRQIDEARAQQALERKHAEEKLKKEKAQKAQDRKKQILENQRKLREKEEEKRLKAEAKYNSKAKSDVQGPEEKKEDKKPNKRKNGYLDPLKRAGEIEAPVEEEVAQSSILAGIKRTTFSRERIKTIHTTLIMYLQEGGNFRKAMDIFYFVNEKIFEEQEPEEAKSQDEEGDNQEQERKENQKLVKRIIDFYEFVVRRTLSLSVIQMKKKVEGQDRIECNIAKRIASGIDIFSSVLSFKEREFITQLLYVSPLQNELVYEGFSELTQFTIYYNMIRDTFLKHREHKKAEQLKDAFLRFYEELTPSQLKRNEKNRFINCLNRFSFSRTLDYRRRIYFKFIQQQLEPKGLLNLDHWNDFLFVSDFIKELNFRETDQNFEILKGLLKHNQIYDSAELSKTPNGKFSIFCEHVMETFFKEHQRMMRYLHEVRVLAVEEKSGPREGEVEESGGKRGIETEVYRELQQLKLVGKEREDWFQSKHDEMRKLLLRKAHENESRIYSRASHDFRNFEQPPESGKSAELKTEHPRTQSAGYYPHDRLLIESINSAYENNESNGEKEETRRKKERMMNLKNDRKQGLSRYRVRKLQAKISAKVEGLSVEMYVKKKKSFTLSYGNLFIQMLTFFILEGGDPLKARDFYFYLEDSKQILPNRTLGIRIRKENEFKYFLVPSLNSDILFAKLALQKFCGVDIQTMALTFKQLEIWNDSRFSEIARSCHALIWLLMGCDLELEALEAVENQNKLKEKKDGSNDIEDQGEGEEEQFEEHRDPNETPKNKINNWLIRHLTTFLQAYTEPEMELLNNRNSPFNTNYFFVYPLIRKMIKEVCGSDPDNLKKASILRELRRELVLADKYPSVQLLRRDSILTMELFVLIYEQKGRFEPRVTSNPNLVLQIVDNLRELIKQGDRQGLRYFEQVTSLMGFMYHHDEVYEVNTPNQEKKEDIEEPRSHLDSLTDRISMRKRNFNYFFYSYYYEDYTKREGMQEDNLPTEKLRKGSKLLVAKQQQLSRYLHELLSRKGERQKVESLLIELYTSILRDTIEQQEHPIQDYRLPDNKDRESANENHRMKIRMDILAIYNSKLKALLSPERVKTPEALEQLDIMRYSTGTDLMIKTNILSFEERYKYLLTDPHSVGLNYSNLKVNQMTLIYLIQHYKDGLNISKLLYDERAALRNSLLNSSETSYNDRVAHLGRLSKSDFIERLHAMKFEAQKLYPFFAVACAKRDLQLIMLIIKIMRLNQGNDESLKALFRSMPNATLGGPNVDRNPGIMMLAMCKPLVCFLFSILEVVGSGQDGFVYNEQTINEILINENNMDNLNTTRIKKLGTDNNKATGFYVFYNIFVEARNFDSSPFSLEYSYRDFLEQLNHFLQFLTSFQNSDLSKFSESRRSKRNLETFYGCPLKIAKASNSDQLIHRFEKSLTRPMFSYYLTNCDIHKIRRIIMEYHHTKEFRNFLIAQLHKIIEDPLDKRLIYSIGSVPTFLCVYLIYLHECFDASHEMVLLFMKALKLFMANKYYEDVRNLSEMEREELLQKTEDFNDKLVLREKASFNPDYILRSAFISFSLRMKPGVDYKLFKKLMFGTLEEIDRRVKRDKYFSFVGRTLTMMDGAFISDIEDQLEENKDRDQFLVQCSLKQAEELNRHYPTQVASMFLPDTNCKFDRSFVISEGIRDIVAKKSLLAGIGRLSRHVCYTKNDKLQELPETTAIPANIKRESEVDHNSGKKRRKPKSVQKQGEERGGRHLYFITEKESTNFPKNQVTSKYLFCVLNDSLDTLRYQFFLETEEELVKIPFERSKYLSLYLNLKSRAIFFKHLGGEATDVMKTLKEVQTPGVPFLSNYPRPFILNHKQEDNSQAMDEVTSLCYLRTWNELQLGYQLDQICDEFRKHFLKNPACDFPKIDGIDVSGLHSEKQAVEFLLKICSNRTKEFQFVKGEYNTSSVTETNEKDKKGKRLKLRVSAADHQKSNMRHKKMAGAMSFMRPF